MSHTQHTKTKVALSGLGGHTTKFFDACQKVNRRDDRWLCVDPSDVMHTKIHASVIVLGMSSEGRFNQLRLFPRGLRLNSFSYTGVLEKVGKPWINFVWDETPYMFPGNLHQPAKLGSNEIR